MKNKDTRWIQRFNNFSRALAQLSKFMDTKELNELEQQGLIQAFEYTHELAWKTQKDFLQDQGFIELYGSKNVANKAFETELIKDGEVWIDMIKSRNLSSHTYNKDTADYIVNRIIDDYHAAFCSLHNDLLKKIK